MNFQVEPTEKPRSLWPSLLAGAVIVVLLLVVFGFLSRHSARQSPAAKPLPFGSAEQGYAGSLKFENLKMSRFANMFNQEVTYLAGDIYNGGDRTIGNLAVTVEFHDVQNQVVMRETLRPLEPQPVPITPGERRPFRLGFEQVPDSWNMQYPTVRVTGLVLQ